MLRFRLTLISLIGWLFLLYNIERLHEPLNIASFVYVLSALGTVLLIYTGGGHRESVTLSALGVCLVLLVVLKNRWGYPVVGHGLPITITEAIALGVTFALASRIAEGVRRFEEGSFELTMAVDHEEFDIEQTQLYGEVRRARQFDRPLALAYVSGDTTALEQAVHPLIIQSQRAAANRYAKAKLAESIGRELGECDMIACHQDGFVVVMPEADRLRAAAVLQAVREKVNSQFNVQLQSGIAVLPSEEVTFTGLLARASAEAKNQASPGADPLEAEEATVEANALGNNHGGLAKEAQPAPAEAVAVESLECQYSSCLGVSLRLRGNKKQTSRYLKLLAHNFGDQWQRQLHGSEDVMELNVELVTESFGPPDSAVEMNGDWFTTTSLYRPTEQGWIRLQWIGGSRWTLARPAEATSTTIEQSMFRLALLRAQGLPLHASVGRCDDIGVVAIGGPESGKTAVLLALLEMGGQWVCDDEGYGEQDLSTVHGTSPTLQVKQGYLRQLPEMSRRVPAPDRWKLRLTSVARRVAGSISHVPKLPSKVRRRLQRVAEGQSSTAICPPGRLPNTTVDVVILVTRGNTTQLEAIDDDTWTTRAAEILWPEVCQLHTLSRQMHAATGGQLIDDEAEVEDERHLQKRVRDFSVSKSKFSLTRSPSTPLIELTKLLRPVLRSSKTVDRVRVLT
jgi:hypothetical protein